MSDSVEIPKRTLGLLVGGLVLSLMGTSFLLGRASVPVAVVTATPSQPQVAPAVPVAVAPASQELAVARPAATPVSPKPKPFPSKEAEHVRAYLAAVDEVSSGTQDLGNPSDFANDLLNQAVMGDTSGVDSLLSQARSSQAALAKIKPPESCKTHYRLLKSELHTSVEVLQILKTALETSDSMALTGMAAKGAAAQRQARELEKITAELRERSSQAK